VERQQEREFARNFLGQVGYTGSEARKLPEVIAVNQAFPGTGNVNARRPYQGYANIQSYNPYINSTYNTLLAKLEHRFSSGMTLLASYTYEHSIDGGGNQNDSNDPGPQDARNLRAQKGSSNFDARHRLVFSGLYQLPFPHSGGLLPALARNWQLSGIFSAQNGPTVHGYEQYRSYRNAHDCALEPFGRRVPAGRSARPVPLVRHDGVRRAHLPVFREFRPQYSAGAGIGEPRYRNQPRLRVSRAIPIALPR
jgi:hypothetical protein